MPKRCRMADLHFSSFPNCRRQNKKVPTLLDRYFFGARYRTRTCDPMHVKHVLYQLS